MREIKFRVYSRSDGSIQTVFYQTVEISSRQGCFNGFPDSLALCQYTGLKDKNGVEIYEGDILGLIHKKHGLQNTKKVVWDDTNACFDWEDANGDSFPDGFTGFYDEYSVIGNIYENPELLS